MKRSSRNIQLIVDGVYMDERLSLNVDQIIQAKKHRIKKEGQQKKP